jgi:hypothetical protein
MVSTLTEEGNMEEKTQSLPQQCRFARMFELQREFMTRLGVEFPLTTRDMVSLDHGSAARITLALKNLAVAMMMEVAEFLDWLPWKSWSERIGNKQKIDAMYSRSHRREALIELVDLQHFLNEAYIIIGASEDEVIELYEAKMAENHRRQDSGGY